MILITADLHWSSNPRDRYRHDYVDTIVKEIKKNRVETALILGDLTSEKDKHDAWLVNQVFSHITRMARWCHVIIVMGNHDYISPDCPFFQTLGHLQGVTWISRPIGFHLFKQKCLFLPHTRDYQRDWDGVDVRMYPLVFTHNTFEGAKAESGEKLSGIPRSVFNRKQVVISGDVHVPQKLSPVEYVGAPYEIKFGDDFESRMLLMDHNGKRISIPYDGPRKLLLNIRLVDADVRIEGLRKDDMLKIQVYLKAGQFGEFQRFKDRVYATAAKWGYSIYQILPVVEPGEPVVTRKRSRKRDDEEVLKDYATATRVKKSVVKTGVKLMRKV